MAYVLICWYTKKRKVEDANYNLNIFMNKLKILDWVAFVLVVVGGLNWGLVGIFKFDLVATIFGDMSALSRVVYTLVGLSALYMIAVVGKLARK
jgi:uncharacterized membrane protein YuzA (DUF378 family)